jgi:ribosomal protein S18 acetylase RimI-like enzyme
VSASPSDPEIRAFTEADRRGLVDLWLRCDLTRPWNDPDRDIDRKAAHSGGLFVALGAPTGATTDAPTQVIGSVMAGYDGHRGWINYLAVDPAWRGSGLGRRLMVVAEEYLRAIGAPKINLQVRTENQNAVAFYHAIGFDTDAVVSMGKRLVDDQAPPRGD